MLFLQSSGQAWTKVQCVLAQGCDWWGSKSTNLPCVRRQAHTPTHSSMRTPKTKTERRNRTVCESKLVLFTLLQKTTENRKEVRNAFSQSLDPWQQFLLVIFYHGVYCFVCVCVCAIHCEWINSGGLSKVNVGGVRLTTALLFASQRLLGDSLGSMALFHCFNLFFCLSF